MPMDKKMKMGSILDYDDSNAILIGKSAQSILAQVDIAQHLRDYILLDALIELHRNDYQHLIYLPYVLPFGQVHCGCCRWNHPYSSARATLASPIHHFKAYFMTSDSSIRPSIPTHLIRMINWQNNPYDGNSSSFSIQPGWTSIWCGVRTRYESGMMFRLRYAQWDNPMSNRHIDDVQCKQFLVAIYSGETNPELNLVYEANWHISVLHNDPYHLAGTFMEDGISDSSPNIILLDPLYLNLSIDLTDNTPSLHFTISQGSDESLALSDHDISELDISVKIEPLYDYLQQSHSSPDVSFRLCRHYNISDPVDYLGHVFERESGPMHVLPEPSLPLHWVRRISDGGVSYFYNKKTSAWSWSPGEAFTCLSFSSSSCTFNGIHDNFHVR
jgi:hypothetical protein